MRFFRRPRSEAEQHYLEALRCRDRKNKKFDLRLAIWHLKQASSLEPANPLFPLQLSRAYAAAPLFAVTRGLNGACKLDEAITLAITEAKNALRLKPNYAEAFVVLGEAYMYLGENDNALNAFDSALEVAYQGAVKAHAEIERRQVEGGLSKKPDPDRARVCLEKAVTCRNQGRFGAADRELDRALRLSPDWRWLYTNIRQVA